VAIALDDFGTGYSSLSYLKRFPIQRLKIDQAFIRDLEHDADDRQITKAIVGLGHSLALDVVAEGVETQGQLAFLDGLGCDIAQGYLFSRPLPAAAFDAALRTPNGFAPAAVGGVLANDHEGGAAPMRLHA
jgi:EAL domain-containing protein (putative c-di-GMP-specific phosphodiesterase class I)